MSSRLKRTLIAGALTALAFAMLNGCGGSGNNGAKATRTGQVQLHIVWPAKSKAVGKYIPAYAASLFFELSPKGSPSTIYTLIVNRPSGSASTQDVMFSQLLSSGTYELAGAARALADAQGATVASGAVEIDVQPGINAVPLTLNSTIKTLQILGKPISAGVGQTMTLQSGAFDPDGNGLLLPDGALTWSVVSGGQFGTITVGGAFTGTAVGVTRVRVAEPVTGVLAEADVTVNAQGSSTGLAASGYPKAAADLGATGLVTGSGAIGMIAWNFPLGNRGVGTPVLGNNNLIFAVQQKGIVYAVNSTTGVMQWQATLPNLLGDLASGSIVATDDNTVIVGYPFGVQAYDAATGLPKWTNGDYACDANMAAVGGKLYVPSSNRGVGVIDIRTGMSLTTFPGLTATYDVAIFNGTIYYATEQVGAGRTAKIYAVNTTTGGTVWSKDIAIGAGGGFAGSFPIVNPAGTVYVGLGDGNLQAFDGMTGAPLAAQTAFITPGSLQPCIGADKNVYFTRRNDITNQFETVRYNSGLDTKLWGSPFVLKEPTVGADGTVYGAGNDVDDQGNQTGMTAVYALNNADGTKKWKVVLN